MSKVYITNASLNLISKSLRNKLLNISRNDLLNDISDDFDENFLTLQNLNEIFNTNELKEIYSFKVILKDFNNLIASIKENKNIIIEYIIAQNKKYAFEIKQPAYHSSKLCRWMNKNFINIEIPYECINNKEMLKKVKKWIEENKHNLRKNFNLYNHIFKREFNCIEGLKKVKLKNSGNEIVDNQIIDIDTNQNIKSKYTQLRFFFDTEFAKKIQNLKYAPNFKINDILKNENDESTKNAIIDFHTIKEDLKEIIIKFYKEKYNYDLSFEQTILDSIGFKSCNSCSKE